MITIKIYLCQAKKLDFFKIFSFTVTPSFCLFFLEGFVKKRPINSRLFFLMLAGPMLFEARYKALSLCGHASQEVIDGSI